MNQLMRRMKKHRQRGRMKQYYLRFFSSKSCPTGATAARLRPESRAVKITRRKPGRAVAPGAIEEARAWIDTVDLEGADAAIATELRKEISSRLGFARSTWFLGYLTL